MMTTTIARPTDKQLAFIRTLLKEREGIAAAEAIRTMLNELRVEKRLGKKEASAAIDALIAIPAPKKPAKKATIADAGMYRDPDTGTIIKVKESKAGRRSAYKLVTKPVTGYTTGGPTHTSSYVYVKGLVYRIKPEWRMSIDDCKEYGVLHGNCIVCGAHLTNPESVRLGIGPVCGGRV